MGEGDKMEMTDEIDGAEEAERTRSSYNLVAIRRSPRLRNQLPIVALSRPAEAAGGGKRAGADISPGESVPSTALSTAGVAAQPELC